MDTIFCNKNDDITEASYEMLKEWRKSQPDAVTAFITLRDALTHPDVNLHQVAQEGLNCGLLYEMNPPRGKQFEVLNMLCGIQQKTLICCLPGNQCISLLECDINFSHPASRMIQLFLRYLTPHSLDSFYF